MIVLTLPWPPSINHMYLPGRRPHSRFLTPQAKAYRWEVKKALLGADAQLFSKGERLRIYIEAYPPDKRRRDLDNLQKCTLDSLQDCSVFEDDSQVDDLRIVRRPPVKLGYLVVTIGALI